MAYTDYLDTVEKMYIAYYQRPADPGGLVYWAQKLDEAGGDLSKVIEAFAYSDEAKDLYGQINEDTIGNVIDQIYQAAFNRPADDGGKQFYIEGFKEGKFTPATIMLNIVDGAQGNDKTVIENKIDSALNFTKAIDPDLDGKDPLATYDANDIPEARQFLADVSNSIKTEDDAKSYVQEKIADSTDLIKHSPVAHDDDLTTVLTVVPGKEISVDVSQLLANDTDPDHDNLTIKEVSTNVEGATVSLIDTDNDGVKDKVKVVVPEGYDQDTFNFTYTVDDGHDHTDSAKVTLGVGSEPSAIDVKVNGEGSHDAAAHDYVYHFTPGTYTYEIQNFGNGDVLVFPEGATPTVINRDFSDGKVIVQWAHSGTVIKAELTGLSEDVDGSLFSILDFKLDEAHSGYTLPEQEGGGETGGGETGGGETGGGELTPNTINVSNLDNGSEYAAADDVAETFVFEQGTYEYTINNFDLDHDVLDLPDSPSPTVINRDFSDGEVTVQWAGNGQKIEVHLLGLTADQDWSLIGTADFGDAIV